MRRTTAAPKIGGSGFGGAVVTPAEADDVAPPSSGQHALEETADRAVVPGHAAAAAVKSEVAASPRDERQQLLVGAPGEALV